MTKHLFFALRLLFLPLLGMGYANSSVAQNNARHFELRGTVYEPTDDQGKTPVANAIISVESYGINSRSDQNGRFRIARLPAGKFSMSVSYLGKLAIDTTIDLTGDREMDFMLEDANFRLKEVAVTARDVSGTNGTSSRISRTAIDHFQANSLSDVMALLPGGVVTNPDLSSAKQITLRMVNVNSDRSRDGSLTAANAFGTSIIINGAPLSNNANLQTLSPSVQGVSEALSGGASPAGGFDVRGVSMDNVESVEVIRGVPGVAYGDLTSGAVIVNTKAGEQPLQILAKTNPNLYQLSAQRGMELGGRNGALNLSVDYARNVTEPTQSYLTYQRLTSSAMYSNTFFNRLKSTTSLDLIYGKDARKLNPDDEITRTSSKGEDLGFVLNTRGEAAFNDMWLRRINYTARLGYTRKNSFLEEQHTAATAPYSMTLRDGAILSNKPGTDVFGVDGNPLTNIDPADRGRYALMLPSTYLGRYDIEGREWNTFFQLSTTFFNKIGRTNHRWMLGADFKSDANNGRGKMLSDTLPPYRNLFAVNSSFRPRSYRDIPAVTQIGLFAEESFSTYFGQHQLGITAGMRYDNYSGSRQVFSPRVNASFDVLPGRLTFHAAYGKLAKAPGLLYTSPERAYFEYININELSDGLYEDPVLMTTTRVFDADNPELKIATNEKTELGFQLNAGQATLRVTAFQERLKNGYRLDRAISGFKPVLYNEYIRTGDESLPVYELLRSNPVLASFATPTNNLFANTKGLEFDLDLGRFEAIRSSFLINGAWIRSEEYSNDYHYYDDQSSVGGAGRTHIGLYEPEMEKRYEQSFISSLRGTHNIPAIGLAVTLTTQVIWNEANWSNFGNDSIPVKYISKNDGQVYDFDYERRNENEFKTLLRPVNDRDYIRESFSPLLSFHMNVTKEIADYMRVSFFANNMFRHYQIEPSKRNPGTYLKRNRDYYFGLQLALTLK